MSTYVVYLVDYKGTKEIIQADKAIVCLLKRMYLHHCKCYQAPFFSF